MAHLAQGVVKSADDKNLILQIPGTSYELHLALAGASTLKVGETVRGVIRARARKVWTMAAGGNFIQPLFGQPRVVQGRVMAILGTTLTVQAGTTFEMELPADQSALDLKNGQLVPGAMVNITLFPDASFSPASAVDSQTVVRRDMPQ